MHTEIALSVSQKMIYHELKWILLHFMQWKFARKLFVAINIRMVVVLEFGMLRWFLPPR